MKTDKSQKEFRSNGKLITDTKLISNKFNAFFTNVGPNLAKKIRKVNEIAFTEYMNDTIVRSMFLRNVTPEEIFTVVSTFKNKTSCGYDNISMSIINKLYTQLSILWYTFVTLPSKTESSLTQ